MSMAPVPEWDEWAKHHPPTMSRRQARQKGGKSYEQRLTEARNRMLAEGVHPVTGGSLREPQGETCGSCAHLYRHEAARTYLKCDLAPMTAGPRTDIRAGWPACLRWSKKS